MQDRKLRLEHQDWKFENMAEILGRGIPHIFLSPPKRTFLIMSTFIVKKCQD